jgi:hypothetical protein
MRVAQALAETFVITLVHNCTEPTSQRRCTPVPLRLQYTAGAAALRLRAMVRETGVRAMAKWQKQTMKMAKNHAWKSSPGYQILVLDRGAARIDIPEGWAVSPGLSRTSRQFSPGDEGRCLLQVTVFPQMEHVDFSGLPLATLFGQVTGSSETEIILRGPIIEERRKDLEIVWRETRFVDPEEKREARTFNIFARRVGIHVLISFSMWPEDVEEFTPAWEEVLRSLRVGEFVDPKTGWRIR